MSGGFSHTDIVGAVGQAGDFGAAASRPCGSAGFLILHRGIDAGNFTVVVAAVCAGNGSHAGSRRAVRLLNSGSRRADDGAAFHTAGDRHGDGLTDVLFNQRVGVAGRTGDFIGTAIPLVGQSAGVAGDRSGFGSQDLAVLRRTRNTGRAAQRTGRRVLMHELEDGFAAAVVCAVIAVAVRRALFAFRAAAESHLASDHGVVCLLARRGERHRAFGRKVNRNRRAAVICPNNFVIATCSRQLDH